MSAINQSTKDIDDQDIKSLSDDEEDDDNDIGIKHTLLGKSQKLQLKTEGYCMMDPIVINIKITNLCHGYIRMNENNKIIGITGIILKIIKYCQGRYDPKYYVELKSGSSSKADDIDSSNIAYYLIPKTNAKLSRLLSAKIDTDSIIELNKVPPNTLDAVCQYLGHHKNMEPDPIQSPLPSNNLKDCISDEWDIIYINKFRKKDIFEIILAANYMDIKGLMHLGCAKIATLIKGLDANEINRVIQEEETHRTQTINRGQTTGNTASISPIQPQQPQQQQPQQQQPQQQQNQSYDDELAQAIRLSLMDDNSSNNNGKWNCTVCTYQNIGDNVLCEMCFTQKQ